MSAINVKFTLADTETAVVQVDRWGEPSFSVALNAGTSVLVEGTLVPLNGDDPVVWRTLDDDEGAALAALLPNAIAHLKQQPLEAIRITATGACTGRVVQSGAV